MPVTMCAIVGAAQLHGAVEADRAKSVFFDVFFEGFIVVRNVEVH